MVKYDWIWMPHAGHFICGDRCQFHLSTYVGGYVVSTVGDYLPCEGSREIMAQSRGVELEGKGDARLHDYMKKIGFEEIGCDRKYETMVFKAKKSKLQCCPYRIESGENLDFDAYNEGGEARKGHMKMCRKWARKPKKQTRKN